MYIVCNRIPVNPGYEDAFEERFANRANLVDGMPGFVSFNLLRPQEAGDPYVVMTFWESEADFKNWTDSESFKDGHKQGSTLPPETFAGRPKLEYFEVIQSAEKTTTE